MRTIKIHDESVIRDIVSRETGGHIYVEYIMLTNGIILTVTDECVGVWKDNDDAPENEIGYIYFD